MAYIGAGISRFNTADELTVTGDAQIDGTTLVIDSTNNRVGVGTAAPDVASHIVGTNGKTTLASHDAQTAAVVENNSDAQFAIVANSANSSQLFFGDESSELVGRIRYDHSADAMRFYTNSSERLRIDSSGNLLVGTTDTSPWNNTSGTGILASSGGVLAATSSGDAAFYGNRLSSDGDIIQLRKDGTTVASIGSRSTGTSYIALSTTSNTGLTGSGAAVCPSQNGSLADNAVDFGFNTSRFKDLYLSGGAYLGGTGSANKLDDYEEGTWTPVPSALYGFSQGVSASYSGNYVKIGDLVYVNCSLDFDTSETLALGDRFIMQGLPFTMTGNKNGVGGGSFIQPGSFSSGTHVVGTVASNSQSQDELMCVVTRVNGTPPALDNTNVNCAITYRLTNTFS